MRNTLALLACLCVTAVFAGNADAEFKLVGPTKVKTAKQIKLKVEGFAEKAGVIFRYDKKALDGGKVNATELWLVGKPGTYVIEAMAVTLAKDGQTLVEETSIEVTVEEDGEVPGPGPGPGPLPNDTLATELKALYAGYSSPTKAVEAALLANVYRAAAAIVERPAVATLADLETAMKAAADSVLKREELEPVRKRLQVALADLGIAPDGPIDAATKKKAKDLFSRIAVILSSLK